jgi:hypothetical protein
MVKLTTGFRSAELISINSNQLNPFESLLKSITVFPRLMPFTSSAIKGRNYVVIKVNSFSNLTSSMLFFKKSAYEKYLTYFKELEGFICKICIRKYNYMNHFK